MITHKELNEIVLLYETGTKEDVIGNIYNIDPKKIKKYYLKGKKIFSRDVDEADAAAAGGASTGGGSGTAVPAQTNVSKWESGITRGRANQVDQNHKWESGVTKGRANR